MSERESEREREWRERENKTSNIERNIKRERDCVFVSGRERESGKREKIKRET